MNPNPVNILLIGALRRELDPLVEGWHRAPLTNCGEMGRELPVYRSCRGDVVAVAAGVGSQRASLATKVLIETFRPEVVTSIGFTGSLDRTLGIGAIITPSVVIDAETGERFETEYGSGTLVTVPRVAGSEAKRQLVKQFNATCVDMEAAGVARAAHAAGVKFLAVKAVSDSPDDPIEFTEPFVTPDGFRTGAFLAHVLPRPRLWSSVVRLAKNGSFATRTLKEAVQKMIADPEAFADENRTDIRTKV